jgi:hypothetical protein
MVTGTVLCCTMWNEMSDRRYLWIMYFECSNKVITGTDMVPDTTSKKSFFLAGFSFFFFFKVAGFNFKYCAVFPIYKINAFLIKMIFY